MKTKQMNTAAKRRHVTTLVSSLVFGLAPFSAQAAEDMGGMDMTSMHGGMTHKSMPTSAPEMSHEMSHGSGAEAAPTQSGMSGMSHGEDQGSAHSMDMQAQGGSAPADARDPHAYADGYTLDSGKYALAGPRTLMLADEHNFASVLFDRLERTKSHGDYATSYDLQAWFGRTYDRLVIKAEGKRSQGRMQEARTELLWSHALASYWDTQLGMRQDNGIGPNRSWLAFGVQGLAPYWFAVDATAYVGEEGRSALRLAAEYELLLTQRLILQPRVELNAYGKEDAARGLGRGLADGLVGLRLRYEISRQFAPYVGVERAAKFGSTADFARADGEASAQTRWVAGLRFWF